MPSVGSDDSRWLSSQPRTVPVRRATPFFTSTSSSRRSARGGLRAPFSPRARRTRRAPSRPPASTAPPPGAGSRVSVTWPCMLYRTRWSSAASRDVAGGGARGRSGQPLVGALGKGGSGRCPAPTGWSLGLPLWTSDSATNLPTVAPAPTACGYGAVGGAGSMPGALRRGRSGFRAAPRLAPGRIYSGLVRAIRPTRVRDLLDGGDRLVLVQLVVERLQADPERLGRLLLVAALLVQGGEYEPALRFGERATDPELDHPARHRSLGLRPVRELRAQERNVPGLDLLVGEDEGAVQGILEL